MRRLAVLLVLLLAGCASAMKLSPSSAVDELYKTFSRAYDTLDADLVSGLYAPNALYLEPDGKTPVQHGPAIPKIFHGFFGSMRERGSTMAIRFHILERFASDDMVVDVGYFQLTTTPKQGDPRTGYGKFTTTARPQPDGTWKFVVDGYSNAPAEEASKFFAK